MLNDLPLGEIHVGPRHRRDLGDVAALAASIADVGLLQPVVVTEDRRLIAGLRRLKAFEQLGRARIPAILAKNLTEAVDLLKAERDENTCRLAFTLSEAHDMGEAVAAAYKPKAEEARAEGRKKGGHTGGRGRPKNSSPQSLGKPIDRHACETSSQAAAAVGMSRPTFEKIGAVKASGDKALIAEMDRTGKVSGAYKKLKRAEAAEQIAAEPPPLPAGPFRVIVADPPWQYDKRDDDPSHRATCPYPCMTGTTHGGRGDVS